MRNAFEEYSNDGSNEAWKVILPLLAPDFELTTPPGLAAEPDTYRGEEGMRRYFDSFYEVMDQIRIEPREFHEVEGWVVAPFTMTARGRTTGIESGIDAVMAWRFRDGLAVRGLVFQTVEEAMAAIAAED